jgi:hypothetical protein
MMLIGGVPLTGVAAEVIVIRALLHSIQSIVARLWTSPIL